MKHRSWKNCFECFCTPKNGKNKRQPSTLQVHTAKRGVATGTKRCKSWTTYSRFQSPLVTTLSPKIMEVENGCSWKVSNGKYYNSRDPVVTSMIMGGRVPPGKKRLRPSKETNMKPIPSTWFECICFSNGFQRDLHCRKKKKRIIPGETLFSSFWTSVGIPRTWGKRVFS